MNLFNIIAGHHTGQAIGPTIEQLQTDHANASAWLALQKPVMRRGQVVWHEIAIIASAWSQTNTHEWVIDGTPEMAKLRTIGEILVARLNSKMVVPKHHATIINAVFKNGGVF